VPTLWKTKCSKCIGLATPLLLNEKVHHFSVLIKSSPWRFKASIPPRQIFVNLDTRFQQSLQKSEGLSSQSQSGCKKVQVLRERGLKSGFGLYFTTLLNTPISNLSNENSAHASAKRNFWPHTMCACFAFALAKMVCWGCAAALILMCACTE